MTRKRQQARATGPSPAAGTGPLARLRHALRARDTLLALVSHDLQNPLATIKLTAQHQLLRCAADEDGRRSRRQMEMILRAAEGMQQLLNNLLQSTAIESGTFTMAPRSEDVTAILDDLLEMTRPLADERRLRIERDVAGQLPRVLCDRQRIAQVLFNLLGNAVKFAPEGSRLFARARPDGGAVVISIVDSGPGISRDELPRLFERRWRTDPAGGHGFGLGLFIARSIVEAHGGRIWAVSEAGVGSTFSFSLPPADRAPRTATPSGRRRRRPLRSPG